MYDDGDQVNFWVFGPYTDWDGGSVRYRDPYKGYDFLEAVATVHYHPQEEDEFTFSGPDIWFVQDQGVISFGINQGGFRDIYRGGIPLPKYMENWGE